MGEGPETPKISRREFLRWGMPCWFSLTAFLSRGLEPIFWGKQRFLSKTPEGYQIGMALGIHEGGEVGKKVAVTQIEKEDLFSPVGGLFLDSGLDYLNPEVQKNLPDSFHWMAENEEKGFLQEPMKYALENNIPIIIGDITIRFKGDSKETVEKFVKARSRSLFLTETSLVATNLALSLEALFEERVSRRGFLKALGAGGALATTYFSSEAIIKVIRGLGLRLDCEAGRDLQAILSDAIHPDDFALVMRNIVWALKCQDFYKMGVIGKDKILNVIGGEEHQFFDFFVRHPKIARRYWHLFGYDKVAAEFSGGDPSWVYKSYVFEPQSNQGRIIIHEGLKTLVT